MPVLNLLKNDDARLRKISTSIFGSDAISDEAKTAVLGVYLPVIEAMFETMYASGGIGLAAPQVGINKRIFIYDIPANHNFPINTGQVIVIDPEITDMDGKAIEYGSNGDIKNGVASSEGCLSVPYIYESVQRLNKIKFSYTDQNGQRVHKVVEGLEAFCIQHELDHLNGVLFTDRLSRLKKNILNKSLQKGKGSSIRKMEHDLNRESGALRLF